MHITEYMDFCWNDLTYKTQLHLLSHDYINSMLGLMLVKLYRSQCIIKNRIAMPGSIFRGE